MPNMPRVYNTGLLNIYHSPQNFIRHLDTLKVMPNVNGQLSLIVNRNSVAVALTPI